jgi:asparagine synthase (glutamine-hydrolysing)
MAGRLQKLPNVLRAATLWPLVLLGERARGFARRVASTPLSRWNRELRAHMTRHWLEAAKRELWREFSGLDSDRLILELYDVARSERPLEQLLSVYQRGWLVEDLLMKADKMSMAASVELRVPFLDYRLVQWANRQPAESKVRYVARGRYETKYLLRRFASARLPETILQRPKQGFPVPAYEWLREETFAASMADRMTGNRSRLAGAFDRETIHRQIAAARIGDADAAHRVWILVVLDEWLRQYGMDLV